MRSIAVALLVTIAACRSGRLYAHDVAKVFSLDYAEAAIHVPSKKDLRPRAEGDTMERTVSVAEAYLAAQRREDTFARYVRALLACAHLLRGDTERAHEAIGHLKSPIGTILSHQNRVVEAAVHTLDGCRSVEARIALDEFFEGRLEAAALIVRHGGYLGIELPEEQSDARRRVLDRQARELTRRCFSEVPGDPYALERVSQARRDLRQVVSEQIYNEAAALLGAIPEDAGAESECFTAFMASLFVVHGYVTSDLLPYTLRDDQKQWYRELAMSVYARARTATERYLRGDRWMLMRYRLDAAELMTVGWISTR